MTPIIKYSTNVFRDFKKLQMTIQIRRILLLTFIPIDTCSATFAKNESYSLNQLFVHLNCGENWRNRNPSSGKIRA